MSNAVTGTNMASVSHIGEYQEETVITAILARNNACVPDKYKSAVPVWYQSTKSSNTNPELFKQTFFNIFIIHSPMLNMSWYDLATTNEDYPEDLQYWDPTYNPVQYHPDTLWWPRNITGEPNAYGETGYYDWRNVDLSNVIAYGSQTRIPIYDGAVYTPYTLVNGDDIPDYHDTVETVTGEDVYVPGGTHHDYTHDYTYKAICLTGNTFVNSITRYMYSLQSFT
jgi:hypothetical protein